MPNLEIMSTDELLDGSSRDKFVQEEVAVPLGLLQRGLITSVSPGLNFKEGRKSCHVEYLEPVGEDEEGTFIFTDMDDNLPADAYDLYDTLPYFLKEVGSWGDGFIAIASE